ncbi:hypothetical protein K6119_19190 [Paracrocinitomix mangrovi]|uniref:hypothetical protein n=1 Tax=Paracrocinitomix mangrovi TaxID=2862509 RepID=UPI001C8DF103|nr:hypothetical protein [Paracrocinitomix mangrovi]UKN01851.1 hypothetical protein K6119_19190 [Paracrocinitomix mangrovi]
MKFFNIVGIIVGLGTVPATVYYIESVNRAHWGSWDFLDYYGPSAAEITAEAALIFILIHLFFIIQNIANLVKIKTGTVKVLSIVGLSLLGVSFMFNLIMMAQPTHTSFDEGGQVFMLAGIMMMAFSIVYLVQSVRYNRVNENPEILDDDIV